MDIFFRDLANKLNKVCQHNRKWEASCFKENGMSPPTFEILKPGCLDNYGPCTSCRILIQEERKKYVKLISPNDYIAVKFFDKLSTDMNDQCKYQGGDYAGWYWRIFKYNLETMEFVYDNDKCCYQGTCESCERIMNAGRLKFKQLKINPDQMDKLERKIQKLRGEIFDLKNEMTRELSSIAYNIEKLTNAVEDLSKTN